MGVGSRGRRGAGSGGKIKHFRQLEAWQEAHRLVLMVYKDTKVTFVSLV